MLNRPIYCSFGAQGSSELLRAAADAQDEVMAPFFSDESWKFAPNYFKEIPALSLDQRPKALGGLEIVGLVIGFIGSCFAKKIFDEIYDKTLKRPIANQLDHIFNKINLPVGKAIEYRDVIYLEDIDLIVVIRVLADKEVNQALQLQLMQAHRVAHSYIELHGRKAPIHCHEITNGLISAEPELYNSLEEIKHCSTVHTKGLPQKEIPKGPKRQ